MTSDHFGIYFGASGDVKLGFSAAPGLDPWHGVPGGMRRALRAVSAICLTANRWACCADRLETASLRRANPCQLKPSRSARQAVASSCAFGLTRVIAVLHNREHNHEAHCVRCHRVHGGRIRRAGPVPGGAAGGEDLGVLGRLSLQTLPRRRSSARALSAEFGSQAVDATPHAIKHRSRPSASSTRRRARARRRASRCRRTRSRRRRRRRPRRRPRPRQHRHPRPHAQPKQQWMQKISAPWKLWVEA